MEGTGCIVLPTPEFEVVKSRNKRKCCELVDNELETHKGHALVITGPYFVFQEKHEKRVSHPCELALFKMKAKGKTQGFAFCS